MVGRQSNLPRANAALDAANFFLADVRDGLGPYLAVYLLTIRKWDEASIGIVMSVAALAGLAAQTPAGALIDATAWKRSLMMVAAVLVMIASISLPWLTSFAAIATSQATANAAAVIFAPALAAVTLGIFGRGNFTARIGRNETFNHAGNAIAAGLAGIGAFFYGPQIVFYLLTGMAVASLVSVGFIPADAIDHDLAREQEQGDPSHLDRPLSSVSVLVSCRPLLIFALCCVLFHLANAAMLPLVGQKLALADKNFGTSLMSVCIVAAQLVMAPMALLVGAKADSWGRKPFFLAAFAVLAARGFLYVLSDNMYWLVGVQILDGIGAGIFGALFPVVVADLMRGTGRFNVAQSAVITAQGIGAALSTTVGGLLVVQAGYSMAFMTLGALAGLGLALYAFAMPETGASAPSRQS